MKHTLVALVENEPGVLNRVASLFRRRMFNIDSLTVGRTEHPDISRMTITMDSNVTRVYQVKQNLYKLVNVIEVQDISEVPSITRDLALIKVPSSGEAAWAASQHGARVIDNTQAMMIIEMCADEAAIEALVAALTPYGIIEMVRTGVVALSQGETAMRADEASLEGIG
jgi:acetolactate synthase I/III small subunit